MGLLTAQQITRYYEVYRDVDVTFTKEVINAIGLLTKSVYLKNQGHQIPCVIYSTSMSAAKVVVNVKSDLFLRVRDTKKVISLRFAFQQADKPTPLSFYVTCRIKGYSPYGKDKHELNFVSLAFPQRPPDDLIVALGSLLEAHANSKRRKEERIIITADSAPKLGLKSKEAVVLIQNVARKCIVRDISFSGSRLIVPGFARFLADKPVVLQLEFEDLASMIELPGRIARIESVAEREDIAAIAVQFDEEHVPLPYLMRVSEYLSTNPRRIDIAEATEA